MIEEIKQNNEKLITLLDDKQLELEQCKEKLGEKTRNIAVLNEKILEYEKLDQKVKMVENKYTYDVALMR